MFLPLATGCMASRWVKGKGYARYPHPFPALRFGLRLPVPPLPPLPAKQRQERCSQADGGSRGWCGPQPRRARTRPLDAAGAPHAMPGGRSSGPKARNPCSRGSRRRGWRVQRGKASLETTASTQPILASIAGKTRHSARHLCGYVYLNQITHTSCKIELPTARRHHGRHG